MFLPSKKRGTLPLLVFYSSTGANTMTSEFTTTTYAKEFFSK
jgi:hypothetical protein